MILCQNGHENEDGATYCKVCHAYIDSTTAPQPQPTFVPPGVTISPDRIVLAPGGEETVSARIFNAGATPDDYVIEVIGEVATWTSVQPWTVGLAPGEEGDVSLSVRAPEDPDPAQGTVTCSLRVRSGAHPDQPVTVELTIQLAEAHVAAAATLEPERATGRARTRHIVTVVNEGSTQFEAAIGASDRSGKLRLTVKPERVEVPAGRRATATVLAAHPARRLWAKDDAAFGFEVTVVPERAAPIVLAGETVARSRSVSPLVLLVILGVILAAFFFRYEIEVMIRGGKAAEVVTRGSRLRVRAGPGTDTDIVARVQNGERLIIDCRTDDGWLRLLRPNKGGFVFSNFVEVNGIPGRC